MARIAALMELQPVDRRKPQEVRNNPGRQASPPGNALTLGNRNTTSQEEALRRIASLPLNRQGKVLDIRCQIAQGTYEVGKRLDKVIDRVLETLTS
jgi:anti-sigma28 factor (negative regulator of flagellin synthesis)